MADGFVQVAPDSTGAKMDTSELTVGANVVERQRTVIASDTTAAGVAAVVNTTPASNAYGLAVRTVGQSIIQGLQSTLSATGLTTAATFAPSSTGIDVTQYNIATVRVSGAYEGANITFQQSDDGTNWYTTQGARVDSGLIEGVSGAMTNLTRAWDIPIGGATKLRVNLTAITSGTVNIGITVQSFAYDPCPGVVAQGAAATGTAVQGNPVLIAGSDGTNARSLSTSASGILNVAASIGTVTGVFAPTSYSLNSAASTNAAVIKGSTGTLLGLSAFNAGASTAFIKLYNQTAAPTVGTSVPVMVIPVASGQYERLDVGAYGCRFGTGIAIAITGGAADTDTTAVAASQVKILGNYL